MSGGGNRRKRLEAALFRDIKRQAPKDWSQASDGEKADIVASARLPVQEAVARDTHDRVAVRCPRRSGKSYCALSIALERCLRQPKSYWVIIGLTRPTIKQIYWRPLQSLSQSMLLGLHFQHTELTAYFPNGSLIRFAGAESRAEVEKLRGAAYHGVIVDECKSFNAVVFSELIDDVLAPALQDHGGTLYLIGTPGAILTGPFYEATCQPPVVKELRDDEGNEYKIQSNRLAGTTTGADVRWEWSLHTWTVRDNTAAPKIWQRGLLEKERKGWGDDHPTWRREYLGEWVAAENIFVYQYVQHRDGYSGDLPSGHTWRNILGADFGHRDATAFVIWSYSDTHPGLFERVSFKAPRMAISQMADVIRALESEVGGVDMRVGDPAGGGATMMFTLGSEHELPFLVGQKTKKLEYINHFNSDLASGLIHIIRGGELEREIQENRWHEASLGRLPVEDPQTPNDLCDAALYAWRHCHHRIGRPGPEEHAKGSQAWWEAYEAAQEASAIRRELAKTESAALDVDWWS